MFFLPPKGDPLNPRIPDPLGYYLGKCEPDPGGGLLARRGSFCYNERKGGSFPLIPENQNSALQSHSYLKGSNQQ